MSDTIHIVCLDAPSPPDYGGAIDMYYTITSLAAEGKKIILHYFDYKAGRGVQGLQDFCKEVHAYERKGWTALASGTPYIAGSRINRKLIQRLNADDAPILLEGLHCAGIINQLRQPQRVVVRMHNEESTYYRQLAESSSSFWKKLFYRRESSLLHRYQKNLPKQLAIASLSQTDLALLKDRYHFQQLHFISCFLAWQSVTSIAGRGDYCLYHGNMEVAENEAAAIWLVENVFAPLNIPLFIAGRNISPAIQKQAWNRTHIVLINNPSNEKLDELIRDAQINMLPSFNKTGVKLKLLHALFGGRFCISNAAGVAGSGVDAEVIVANGAEAMQAQVQQYFAQTFTPEMVVARQSILSVYNNRENAKKLSALW